ncbi:MAG: hypothetical protein K2V38_29625 [Gemmataceae bacterium]|nr:hypothetical protein [Gemmataceae bacterium]
MADTPGEDNALLLLRSLPSPTAEKVLGHMSAAGARVRERLRAAPAEPPPPQELDGALAHFFDLRRIAQRSAPQLLTEQEPPPADPIEELRTVPPDQLARALDGEQPGTVALVLTCLDPATRGLVIRRMPPESRTEITIRLTKTGAKNLALLQPLARALVEKTRQLKDVPPEPSEEEMILSLADMLRSFPRADRMPIVAKLEETTPEFAARVVEKLYRMEDLLRIPDRQVQMLLGKLDVKTVAVALKNERPEIRAKVTNNMSSRSKSVLAEETELLGSLPDSIVREAQGTVLSAIRKGEEDGQITMD